MKIDMTKLKTNVTKAIFMLGSSIVVIDGEEITLPDDYGTAYLEGGNTMVPLRAFGESFGCLVSWDQETQTATLEDADGNRVFVKLGDSNVYDASAASTTVAAVITAAAVTARL